MYISVGVFMKQQLALIVFFGVNFSLVQAGDFYRPDSPRKPLTDVQEYDAPLSPQCRVGCFELSQSLIGAGYLHKSLKQSNEELLKIAVAKMTLKEASSAQLSDGSQEQTVSME